MSQTLRLHSADDYFQSQFPHKIQINRPDVLPVIISPRTSIVRLHVWMNYIRRVVYANGARLGSAHRTRGWGFRIEKETWWSDGWVEVRSGNSPGWRTFRTGLRAARPTRAYSTRGLLFGSVSLATLLPSSISFLSPSPFLFPLSVSLPSYSIANVETTRRTVQGLRIRDQSDRVEYPTVSLT